MRTSVPAMPVLRTSPSQMFRPWNATDSLHHCCCMGCCRRCRISGGQAVWIHGQLACTHVQPKIALRERVYRDTLWTTHDPPMCPGSSQHLSFGGSSPSRADGEMLLRSRGGSVQRWRGPLLGEVLSQRSSVRVRVQSVRTLNGIHSRGNSHRQKN